MGSTRKETDDAGSICNQVFEGLGHEVTGRQEALRIKNPGKVVG